MKESLSQIIQDGTAIVDVGGGSVQISLFENGTLITTQNIRIGNLRIREKLAGVEQTETQLERLVEELINNELNSFQKLYLKDREIKNISHDWRLPAGADADWDGGKSCHDD